MKNSIWNHYIRGIKVGWCEICNNKIEYFSIIESNTYFQPFKLNKKKILNIINSSYNLKVQQDYEKNYCIEYKENIATVWSKMEKGDMLLDCITLDEMVVAFMINSGLGTDYLILDGYEEFTPFMQWSDLKLSQPNNDICDSFEIMVEMRDGVKLCTEVYLPKLHDKGLKYPVILSRTPYGKRRLADREKLWAMRGYAVILQDVRGREDSEGDFIGMLYEKNDGEDTLDWIVEQSWSNGIVGTIGGSYGGYVQWAMASSGHVALKAIVSQVSAGSPFSDIERYGGGYNMAIMDWNIMMSGHKGLVDADPIKWKDIYEPLPLITIPEVMANKKVYFWSEYMKHPNYDGFWDEMTFSNKSDNIDIPSLVISGWHDGDLKGTTEIWEMNKTMNRENQRLLIGPWVHRFNGNRILGEYNLGKDATKYNIDILYLQWFDRFLKNVDNHVEEIKTEVFIEGKNQWLLMDNYPSSNSTQHKFNFGYSYEEGKLYKEKIVALGKKGNASYVYNPSYPAPQLIDKESSKPFIPIDYSAVEQRKDVLIFTSDPFEKELSIIGRPKLVLFASSSTRDTDFVARLTRVTKDKKSIRFGESYIRAKYRESFTNPKLLDIGEIYKFELNFPYVGQSISQGEALRVEITSAQYGEMFPNNNTGNDPIYDEEYIIAEQTIYFNEAYGSYLLVDVY